MYSLFFVCFQEINSILSVFNIPIKYIEQPSVQKPYWIVELPTEDSVKKIASRSVLLKCCIELWSRAITESQLHFNLKNSLQNETGKWLIGDDKNNSKNDTHLCPEELITSCCTSMNSFKIEVEGFCKHFTMNEKLEKIEVM